MSLFLWKLSQNVNNGYETYDSAIVVAPDRMSASEVHPARYSDTGEAIYCFDRTQDAWVDVSSGCRVDSSPSWCRPNDVKVVCVGEAASFLEAGSVVCSSYNAG